MKITEHRYSNGITHKKIAMLGIYPPPYGGVSVHVQRVADRFGAQQNRVYFFNTEQRLARLCFPLYLVKLVGLICMKRPHYLYYHSTYVRTSGIDLIILALMKSLLRFAMIIVEHDCRHMYKRSHRYKRWYNWVLQSTGCSVVYIGASTVQSYQQNGIKPFSYTVEQAFVPPTIRTAQLVWQTYPSSLLTFLHEFTPVLAMSAAHLMRIDGKDIYGVDQCIDLLKQLKNRYPDAGLLIGLPQVGDHDYFCFLQQRMQQYGVAEQIYILQGNKELWPLFQKINLFVRPTLSDGDSVSIREALYFGVPVVATDVVERPQEVRCYKSGDMAAFTCAVEDMLVNRVYAKRGHVISRSIL